MSDYTIRKKLGEKARELRQKAQMTQKEVSEQIGIDQTDLSIFERSGERIGIERMEKLFGLYGYELTISEKKTSRIFR